MRRRMPSRTSSGMPLASRSKLRAISYLFRSVKGAASLSRRLGEARSIGTGLVLASLLMTGFGACSFTSGEAGLCTSAIVAGRTMGTALGTITDAGGGACLAPFGAAGVGFGSILFRAGGGTGPLAVMIGGRGFTFSWQYPLLKYSPLQRGQFCRSALHTVPRSHVPSARRLA